MSWYATRSFGHYFEIGLFDFHLIVGRLKLLILFIKYRLINKWLVIDLLCLVFFPQQTYNENVDEFSRNLYFYVSHSDTYYFSTDFIIFSLQVDVYKEGGTIQ